MLVLCDTNEQVLYVLIHNYHCILIYYTCTCIYYVNLRKYVTVDFGLWIHVYCVLYLVVTWTRTCMSGYG